MQPTPTDKLLKPPRGGGKSKETSGFRSAERCLRSLPKQFPVNQIEISEVDMAFIGKPGRLLGDRKTGERAAWRSQTQGRRRQEPAAFAQQAPAQRAAPVAQGKSRTD
jgi:hypothetical protein